MTYAAFETSTELGRPIELYTFTLGTSVSRWTSGVRPITVDTVTYQPIAIERQSISLDPERRTEALRIVLPASTLVVRRYINGVPGQTALLTVSRFHENDGDEEIVEIFSGVVKTIAFSQDGIMAEIAVMPITGDVTALVPRIKYASVCQWILFDTNCGVNSTAFRHLNEVTGVSGLTITVQGLASKGTGWANGGELILPSGDSRLIIDHTGDNVRIMIPFVSSPLGQTVEVFAGCNHSTSHCGPKFSNMTNYGGFPFVPTKNVFVNGIL